MKQLLDKAALAEMLRVSVRTIDRLRASGRLPYLLIRGSVRFNPDDVNAYLAAQRRGGHS